MPVTVLGSSRLTTFLITTTFRMHILLASSLVSDEKSIIDNDLPNITINNEFSFEIYPSSSSLPPEKAKVASKEVCILVPSAIGNLCSERFGRLDIV